MDAAAQLLLLSISSALERLCAKFASLHNKSSWHTVCGKNCNLIAVKLLAICQNQNQQSKHTINK